MKKIIIIFVSFILSATGTLAFIAFLFWPMVLREEISGLVEAIWVLLIMAAVMTIPVYEWLRGK